MTLFASRNSEAHLKHDLSLFAQDQWTMRRLTLNFGLRFDWLRSRVAAVNNPANALFPAYSSPAIDNVPNWRDLNPRIGAAYDLFGNGKTAIKGGINRYVAGASTTVAQTFGPAANFSTTRNWTDANGNFFPDCDLKNPAQQDLRASGQRLLRTVQHPERRHVHQQHERARPRLHRRLGEARLQLASDGHHRTPADDWIGAGGDLCPDDLRRLHRDRQPEPHARRLRPVLHHGAGRQPVAAQRPAALRVVGSAGQRCDEQSRHVRRTISSTRTSSLATRRALKPNTSMGSTFSSRRRLPRRGNLAGGWSMGNTIQNTAISANGGQINNSFSNCYVVDNPELLTSQVSPCAVNTPYQTPLPFQRVIRAAMGRHSAGGCLPGFAGSAHCRERHLHERADQRAADRRPGQDVAQRHTHDRRERALFHVWRSVS